MSSSKRTPAPSQHDPGAAKTSVEAPWLELVAQKVASLQYGVVQIVIHDARVVQVESTERFRFEAPRGS